MTDLINTLLDLKLGEVEPPQAKRKRLFEEEEIQNEVMVSTFCDYEFKYLFLEEY